MCDYQGYEFGASRYPDSVCIDGILYDADNCDSEGNLYEPMEEWPCPMCRPLDAIEKWFDYNGGRDEPEALNCALSLVNDIRTNRGEPEEIPMSAVAHFLGENP